MSKIDDALRAMYPNPEAYMPPELNLAVTHMQLLQDFVDAQRKADGGVHPTRDCEAAWIARADQLRQEIGRRMHTSWLGDDDITQCWTAELLALTPNAENHNLLLEIFRAETEGVRSQLSEAEYHRRMHWIYSNKARV